MGMSVYIDCCRQTESRHLTSVGNDDRREREREVGREEGIKEGRSRRRRRSRKKKKKKKKDSALRPKCTRTYGFSKGHGNVRDLRSITLVSASICL